MKRRKTLSALLTALALLLTCAGCASSGGRSSEPVTVTMWHVYGAQTDSPLNDLIDQFNATVGAEENIRVAVTSVTNNKTIYKGVLAAAYGDPGAPELPDLFVSYPSTVLAMPDDTVLVDYLDYFSGEELEAFLPTFVEEGMIHDRLVVLPVAKSTEILYVNKTAFDRFAAATGAQLSDLQTWEGLFALAEEYAAWTDGQTPDIPGDGKALLVHDFHFNYFQVGVESLGEDFFSSGGDTLAFGPTFDQVWAPYARAAIAGGVWLESGYATEPLRTGDAIVSVASSASVLYFSNIVTYADNTSEEVQVVTLPCPTFREGETAVMQRGAGICTVRSTPEREKACMTFLKWLTEEERNVDFVTSLGYMPVKEASFDQYLPAAIQGLTNPMYVELYKTFQQTQEDYTFYVPPQLDAYLDLETRFEENVRLAMKYGRAKYLADSPETLEAWVWETLDYFKEHY